MATHTVKIDLCFWCVLFETEFLDKGMTLVEVELGRKRQETLKKNRFLDFAAAV